MPSNTSHETSTKAEQASASAALLTELPAPSRNLEAAEAREERAALEARADALTARYRERKGRGEKHPIEDFLHTYYPFSPAQMRRWHPGWEAAYPRSVDQEMALSGDVEADGSRHWYHDGREARRADVHAFLDARADAVWWIYRLLKNSTFEAKVGNFRCFGLHEWAMVYKVKDGQRRHEDLPLRLGQDETDRIVESNKLVCTHIDAFRFFTPEAVPLNSSKPTRETQIQRENPACLHAGMDLYKWSMKLVPLVPSDLVLDCFEHALATRILDMEASPYDCRGLGYTVVPIETEEGKLEYVRRQKLLGERSNELRLRILAHLEPLVPLIESASQAARERAALDLATQGKDAA